MFEKKAMSIKYFTFVVCLRKIESKVRHGHPTMERVLPSGYLLIPLLPKMSLFDMVCGRMGEVDSDES